MTEYYLIPKAVIDEVENPYFDDPKDRMKDNYDPLLHDAFDEGKQALLSKAIKVDLDKAAALWFYSKYGGTV